MTPVIDMSPPAGLNDFLESHGWAGAQVTPVAGDASFRRYFRVDCAARGKAILMDAPPPHEDPRPFIHIAQYLNGYQFRAPEIFATDLTRGFVLLEDFGDRRMREHLDAYPEDEVAVYRAAIDAIVRLSATPPVQTQPYDMATYMREVQLLSEWYMPAMGLAFDSGAFDRMWAKALAPLSDYQRVTVLRDYHAENLLFLPERRGLAQIGLLDFQTAQMGQPAYDLVSLLQDARRDVSPAVESDLCQYFIQKTGQTAGDFFAQYATLGVLRALRILGIFAQLSQRGKPQYLALMPRVRAHLQRNLQHPALADLRAQIGDNP